MNRPKFPESGRTEFPEPTSLDGKRWVDTGSKFLFPVQVMSKLFAGKFISAFEKARQSGQLTMPPKLSSPSAASALTALVRGKSWNVYCKRPFGGAEQLFAYLGRYTHRVGISDHRILNVTKTTVTIATRNDKTATMHSLEFIRRFLMHVLPSRFTKIRHYGLVASSNVKTKLVRARQLLAAQGRVVAAHVPDEDAADEPALTCPHCGSPNLITYLLLPLLPTAARAPPWSAAP